MDHFWTVTLFHLQLTRPHLDELEAIAIKGFGAMGVEEYSLSEPEVDALLGERSYSGGDLPQEVLDEVDSHMGERPNNYRFFFESEDSAKAFISEVEQRHLCESQLEACPQEDWNAEWKKHYSPIKVNELLEVIPSWKTDYRSTSQKQVFIHPGMGFGTGSHETTFLCLKIFTKLLDKDIGTVLDFGSGSGILGLASLLFFPNAKVDFYDIDLEANKNCYHNAEINKLDGKAFRLLLPEVREYLNPSYDLIFANILESILQEEREFLAKHLSSQGQLILSGLLRHQLSGIITAYEAFGLKLVEKIEKGDWGALHFVRSEA